MAKKAKPTMKEVLAAIAPALAVLEADHIPPKPGQTIEGGTCPVCELRRVFDAAGGVDK